jgi:hypothetical protein
MKIKVQIILLSVIFCATTISEAQFPKSLESLLPASSLSTEDAVAGIREALIKGTGQTVKLVSIENGYFGNKEIKIPFPPEAREMEQKLRMIGMNSQVDEAILSFNRAAETAAGKIQPIFVDAIKKMSIEDAIAIVNGNEDAATRYLEKTTENELRIKIKPVIQSALDEVQATRYWKDLVTSYNALPFVKKMNPDLAEYVTAEAINGLFIMIAHEERKIRTDPMARTTNILKEVFGRK